MESPRESSALLPGDDRSTAQYPNPPGEGNGAAAQKHELAVSKGKFRAFSPAVEAGEPAGPSIKTEGRGATWGIFDSSLGEVVKVPKRAASPKERERIQQVRQRGACQKCRKSKRRVFSAFNLW